MDVSGLPAQRPTDRRRQLPVSKMVDCLVECLEGKECWTHQSLAYSPDSFFDLNLVSVDMIQFWLGGMCFHLTSLESDLSVLKVDELNGRGSSGVSSGMLQNLSTSLSIMRSDLEKMGGFFDTVELLYHLVPRLSADSEVPWSVSRLIEALENYKRQIMLDMGGHRWARIDGKYEIYFVNPHPWGESVYEMFPDARTDVIDTGLALGAQLYTASVFHAMRVAERGLKWLAKKLVVKLRDNKKDLPVTEAEWHKIIQGLQGKLKKLREAVKGERRRERLELYSRAADHCDYMREIWRNAVSHTQKSYNASEAENALNRVREFMQLLAGMR